MNPRVLYRAASYATDARSSADAVISALTPAAWYRNATDVVASGGFASIWADYASSDVGLVVPGASGNGATVADSAALDITDNISIAVRVKMSDYTPAATQYFCEKAGSYAFYIKATGVLSFLIPGTAEYDSTVAPTVSNETAYWLMVTRQRSSGDIKFYQAGDSTSIPSSWTQVGTTVSGSVVPMPVTAFDLKIFYAYAGGNQAVGTNYRLVIYSDVTQTTKVVDADFSSQTIGAGSFTESSSNAATVTINTSGAAPAHIGKARDLMQGTGTNQPAYSAGVLTFDGVDNWMRVSFALAQPMTIVAVMKQVTWTGGDYIMDGASVNEVAAYQNTITPNFMLSAGASLGNNGNLAINTYGIVCLVANGASSSSRVNDTAKVSGSAGTNALTGYTIGAAGNSGGPSNIATKEIVIFPSALSDANQSAVITALNNALTVF